MTIHDVMKNLEQYAFLRETEFRQQIAEKDAKIRELEAERDGYKKTGESFHKSAEYFSREFHKLREATGCMSRDDALDWIKRHRAAEAAEQPDTPDAGELVPWDATTRPRGVVMFRHCDETSDKESIVFLWMHNGFETYGGFRFNWKRAMEQLEWSRDGETWHPCGVRKAVAK